jgi:hypothetical protein
VTRVAAFGLATVAPPGWDARIFRHGDGDPTLHLASFPLPPADGEFGTTATGRMPADALFLSLTEYATDEPGRGLFAARPPRALPWREFGERTLLLARPGQRGLQRFFTAAGRDFCLYAVLSDGPRRGALLAAAGESLRALSFAA